MNKIGKIRKIKERESPNDKVYTQEAVAKKLIAMCDIKHDDCVLDPSRGLNGAFFDNLPPCKKDWCEIDFGRDSFEYEGPECDIEIGNPPYSIWTKWLEKTISLKPKKIAYVIGFMNLTTIRLKLLENSGYFLTKMSMVNVRGWFSNTLLVVFEKDGTPILTYDTARY